MGLNAKQGANSKTKLSNSNLVIINQFSMIAGQAPTSTMRPEQYESFVRPFRCLLANGFLLLVGDSPPRIENKYLKNHQIVV